MSQEPLPSPSQADQSFNQELPPSTSSKVWLLTDGLSPLAVGLTRRLLNHGDCVVSGIQNQEFDTPRADLLKALLSEYDSKDEEEIQDNSEEARRPAKERLRITNLDIRYTAQIQAGIAEAIKAFGQIDVLLLCRSEALVGSVEEISATARTRAVLSDQFENNFFSAITILKLVLPLMRQSHSGHIIALTGITAHLGTPGLAAYCASQWALEGYCDSLAYEIAPFNIKVTIVQPNIEVGVLTNKIISVPPLPDYRPSKNKAPLARGVFSRLLDVMSSADGTIEGSQSDELHSKKFSSNYPDLSPNMSHELISETLHCLMAIGGHENPPARFIVGFEGIASVKDKLRTISEELEDFIEVSLQADLPREGMSEEPDQPEAAQTKTKVEEEVKMDA